jgi:hypothetical protein
MRKVIAGMVLMTAAGSAFAYQTSREAIASMVTMCNDYADTGQLYVMLQEQGKTVTPPEDDGYLEPIRSHIQHEVFDTPGSYTQVSARGMGYGYCMDHLESLTLSHKAHSN